jgi:nitrogen fixation NifU-like protein
MSGSGQADEEKVLEDLLRTYGATMIDHLTNPRNFRRLEGADGAAAHTGPCGETMEMFVRVSDGIIAECAFQTDGCGSTLVCGSVATEMAAGKDLVEALGAVSAETILEILGGLPEENVHCARLAAETLRLALADYLRRRKEPWKKKP